MAAIVIAVVGSKSSGKTTTVEILTRELDKRSHRVAAIKHVSESNFTIDQQGKDTWRFAQAGAKTIVSVSSDEVATIEKTNGKSLSLNDLLQKCVGNDIVFLEGFRKLVSKRQDIGKVVVVKSAEEAREAVKIFDPILVFTGPYATNDLDLKIPYVDVLKNPQKIADIIEEIARSER